MRDAEIPIDKTSLDILYVAETKHKYNDYLWHLIR